MASGPRRPAAALVLMTALAQVTTENVEQRKWKGGVEFFFK
jgi:hypothetical protein